MGRPNQYRNFDEFTPTGSGRRLRDEYPPHDVPAHQARYKGRPRYMTSAEQQAKLRRKGEI